MCAYLDIFMFNSPSLYSRINKYLWIELSWIEIMIPSLPFVMLDMLHAFLSDGTAWWSGMLDVNAHEWYRLNLFRHNLSNGVTPKKIFMYVEIIISIFTKATPSCSTPPLPYNTQNQCQQILLILKLHFGYYKPK